MKKTTKTRGTGTTRRGSVKKKSSTSSRGRIPVVAARETEDAASEDARSKSEKKTELLAALADALGIALFACKRANVRYEDYLAWRRDDPEFARCADLVGERAIDFVEGKAFEEIKKGNARLIQFYLQTKGRARGYAKESAPREESRPTRSPLSFLTEDEMEY